MVRRIRFWRLKRRLRHRHFFANATPTNNKNLGYSHSHLNPDIDHQHEIDACCQRNACWDFPLHRAHPIPVK